MSAHISNVRPKPDPVLVDIAEGQVLTRSNIRSIRPGFGLPPRELPTVIGKRAKVQIARGTPLAWELIG